MRILALAILFILGCLQVSLLAEDKKSKIEWIEVRGLVSKERLAERPGNFMVLSVLSRFLDGLYAMRPKHECCAFPYIENDTEYSSQEDLEKDIDAVDKFDGNQKRNLYRKFNFDVIEIKLLDPKSNTVKDMFKNWKRKNSTERLATLNKRYGNARTIIAVARIRMSSLQSDKEPGDETFIFYTVFLNGEWKVAWYDRVT